MHGQNHMKYVTRNSIIAHLTGEGCFFDHCLHRVNKIHQIARCSCIAFSFTKINILFHCQPIT